MNTTADAAKADALLTKKSPPSTKTIAAITIGNGLEFFDFTIYSFFAVIIGKQFFPNESETTRLMLSFAVFGVGFIMRPLGGILIGVFADRVGRKPAMMLTLWMMALGSGLFVVAPTFTQIGVAASLLIVVARLIQGFAVGGELGVSTSLLIEHAADHSRGYYGSWQLFSQGLATLFGSAIGVVLTTVMSTDALESWGWRIPFGIGLALIPVGIYIRHHVEETGGATVIASSNTANEKNALSVVLHDHWREVLIGFGIMIGGSTAALTVMHYLTNYARAVLHMPLSTSLWSAVTAASTMMVLSPLAGVVSDRVGRRPAFLVSYAILMMMAVPAFLLMNETRDASGLLGAVVMLCVPFVFGSVSGLVLMTELFPKAVRATGLSLTYGLGTAIFGGFAQFNHTWLIGYTGSNLAPAWYLIGCGLVAFVAVSFSRETAPLVR